MANFPASIYDADLPASRADSSLTQSEWNAVQDEIEAIETALGANMAKVARTIKSKRIVLAAGTFAFNFVAQGFADESDANYEPQLTATDDEVLWVTLGSITTTGFTINSSNGGSAGTVLVSVVRNT